MTINFILFGSLEGTLKTIITDKKFIDRTHKGNAFNPTIVFDLCRALFSLATDLEGGKLKNLDMTHYMCITKVISKNLVIMGIDKSKKMDEQIDKLNPFLKIIADILNNVSKESDEKEIPSLLKNVPILGKEIKKMNIQCC